MNKLSKSDRDWIDGFLSNSSREIIWDFLNSERRKCGEMLSIFNKYRSRGFPKNDEARLHRVLGFLEGKIGLIDSIQNLFEFDEQNETS